MDFLIHSNLGEPLFLEIIQDLFMSTLDSSNYRCENDQSSSSVSHNQVSDILGALRANRAPAFGAVMYADSCKEEAKIIIDLRDGSDR